MTRLGLNRGADVDDLKLKDIIDAQPGLPPRGARRWMAQNWLAGLMLLTWAAGQLLTGDRWVQARTSNETELAHSVDELKHQLDQAAALYVRQDVFAAELRAISTQLASMNAKLDRR